METLRGIDNGISQSHLIPGCAGLKEVVWIESTTLMLLRRGQVDESVGLRPAVGNRMTDGEESWQKAAEADIERVRGSLGLLRIGENRWIGDKMPNFQFMSFSPQPVPGKEYDSLNIKACEVGYLRYNRWKFVNDIENWSRCRIYVCQKESQLRRISTLDFTGSKNESMMQRNRLNITWNSAAVNYYKIQKNIKKQTRET